MCVCVCVCVYFSGQYYTVFYMKTYWISLYLDWR